MTRRLEVVTPEQVAIRYELAGLGSRGVAAMVDVALQVLALIALAAVLLGIAWVLMLFEVFPAWEELERTAKHLIETMASVLIGIGIAVSFLIMWGYHIAFETLWGGETPGKRLMRLRVIKDGGYPVDFRAVLVRNLMRAVDVFPSPLALIPTYGVGFISVLANDRYKRLGDLAAGTVVVRHGTEEEITLRGFGDAVVYRLLDTSVISQLSRLQRDEYRMVRRFLDRRHELPAPLRAEFAHRLAAPLIEKFGYHAPEIGMDDERWLEEIDLAYRTRTLGAPAVVMPEAAPVPTIETTAVETEPAPQMETRKW